MVGSSESMGIDSGIWMTILVGLIALLVSAPVLIISASLAARLVKKPARNREILAADGTVNDQHLAASVGRRIVMEEGETENRNTGAGGTTGNESGPTTGAGGATGNEEAGENPARDEDKADGEEAGP